MTIRLTIIGLDQIGASIGLALKDNPHEILRIGNDPDPQKEQKALKMGALDEAIHNLHAATENADIVILAVAVDEVRSTLSEIAPDLKPGAVVLDTSPLKLTVTQWYKDLLPEERYLVAFSPSLNPAYLHESETSLEQAHADLFKGGLFTIACPPGTHEDALRLAGDLATLLGASPYFADPYESDGLIAAVRGLPQISAAALLTAITHQPGWREARKLAGHAFIAATEPLMHLDDNKQLGASLLLNRENLLRLIDNYVEVLQEVRSHLATQDQEKLKAFLDQAIKTRNAWWQQRQKGDWEAPLTNVEIPSAGQTIARLFGLGKKPSKTTG